MDTSRRSSAFDNFLKMIGLSNTPTIPLSDEDVVGDVDEPPDHVPEISKDAVYAKSIRPSYNFRRESLLTQAIMGPKPHDLTMSNPPRAFSTASSQSIPSTAELTSDGDISPARSASPSPPLPAARFPITLTAQKTTVPGKVIIAPVTHDDKPVIAAVGEAAVEKSLGRKRCIMFACADVPTEQPKEFSPALPTKPQPEAAPEPRKSRLTFACPSRQDSAVGVASPMIEKKTLMEVHIASELPLTPLSHLPGTTTPAASTAKETAPSPLVALPAFHEFANTQDDTDAWVDKPVPVRPKLTLDDCMKKENAIRQIAKEAEDEADEEEREQEEMENELEDDQDVEDDFAPSDEEADSDGNESDDEGGFAESDDESEDGSEYQFWAPGTTTAATSIDNLTHFSSRQRSRGSSISSNQSQNVASHTHRMLGRGKVSRAIKMRPGTPELPDSTDFVCGTLDEDRPLEAAYISCREQRKREKHVLIPQDIDPSFPTTDPEDNEDDDEDDLENASDEPAWLNEHFGGMDDENRGRRPSAIRIQPAHTPAVLRPEPVRPQLAKRKTTNRSPPPPVKHRSPPPPMMRNRSPAPLKHRSPSSRRLFGQSPHHVHSTLTQPGLRSPRGSPTNEKLPLGITITRLAQRPNTNRTASLPHTPNPFFRNWTMGSPATSCIRSGAVTPGLDHEESRPDLHVRGPVDIVIGLEKKRQKRKEKFWRQHCRKAAKEQADRKCAPGRGVERMKELGLGCAERTRGYGLGQQAQLVLSL